MGFVAATKRTTHVSADRFMYIKTESRFADINGAGKENLPLQEVGRVSCCVPPNLINIAF